MRLERVADLAEVKDLLVVATKLNSMQEVNIVEESE